MAQFRNYGTIPLPTTAILFLCLKSRYKYALFAGKKMFFQEIKRVIGCIITPSFFL